LPEMSAIDADGSSDYERKVFRAFMDGGRLKAIPAKRKKREVLLRHILRSFEKQRVYRESEVNAVLAGFHEDVATLRRELVEMGLLIRHRGEYARPRVVAQRSALRLRPKKRTEVRRPRFASDEPAN